MKNIQRLTALLPLASVVAFFAAGQTAAQTALSITNFTVTAENVFLAWEDYGARPEIVGLQVHAKDSLRPEVQWASVTNVAKHITDVTLPADGAPMRFFRLVADVMKKVWVTFDANEGVEPDPEMKHVTVGEPYGDLPDVTRAGGYTFAGWFTTLTDGVEVTAGTTVTETSDHFLYAQWTANVVNWIPPAFSVTVTNDVANTFVVHAASGEEVSFTYAASGMPAGISFASASRTVTVAKGTAPGTYHFSLSAAPSNGLATQHLAVTVSVAQRLNVTFDPGIGNASFTAKDVMGNEAYGNLPTASHASYTFAGWWTDATAGTQVLSTTTVAVQNNHTLYARWAYLGAPANITFVNSSAQTATIPVGQVSPAGAELTFTTYNARAYKSGVAGNALPSGTGSSGAAWAMSFNPANRQVTIPAGTSVGRYQLYATVQVTGTSPALTLTSPSFTAEVREYKQYYYNDLQPGATVDWTNPRDALRGTQTSTAGWVGEVDGDMPHAWVDPGWLSTQVFYLQRTGIGNEQPTYVRALYSTIIMRLFRSREGGNVFTIEQHRNGTRTTLVNDNNNPPAGGFEYFATDAALARGDACILQISAYRANVGKTSFYFAWARYNVTWAPPATGITY